jgi:hypothetical protein
MIQLLGKLLQRLQDFRKSPVDSVWIKTPLSLTNISYSLELNKENIIEDCENYWEWVIGVEPETGLHLDIYRTHQIQENEETEVFISKWENGACSKFNEKEIELLANRLISKKIGPVYFGKVDEPYHHVFKAKILKEWKLKNAG